MPQALAILQLGQGLKMSWAVPSGAFPLRDFPHATATAQSPPTRVPSVSPGIVKSRSRNPKPDTLLRRVRPHELQEIFDGQPEQVFYLGGGPRAREAGKIHHNLARTSSLSYADYIYAYVHAGIFAYRAYIYLPAYLPTHPPPTYELCHQCSHYIVSERFQSRFSKRRRGSRRDASRALGIEAGPGPLLLGDSFCISWPQKLLA